MKALQAELDSARDDKSVRVVVIAAAGKLFSAGHDLKEMTLHRSDADQGRTFFEHTFGLCSRLMQTIVKLPKPVIAEVDGIATAAGCQLAASCDLAFASDRAKFGVNGVDVGLFCSTPAVALTRNISLKHAMEMLMTGEMIDAAAAEPSASLTDVVDEYARKIASKSPDALKLGKAAVHRQAGLSLVEAYECASRAIVENMLAPDAEEGINAFLERRQPKWRDQ